MTPTSFQRISAFAGFCLFAGLANAGTYTFTDLGTLGEPYSDATAINNTGQVAGTSFTSALNSLNQHATLWSNGTITDLGTLGGTSSYASAINNTGQVAGSAETSGNAGYHATLWSNGTTTDLGTLGGTESGAYGINNTGQVAGFSNTSGNTAIHATLWSNGTTTDLGTLGGNYSYANAINNTGQVAGVGYTSGNIAYHATLWSNGTTTDLGTLGGNHSYAFAINSAGQVAGFADSSSQGRQATMWTLQNGTWVITNLNSLLDASTLAAGWDLQMATGINDNGWIVGDAYNSITLASDAFLLSTNISAVPEPETYAMLLVGLGLIGFIATRRKYTAENNSFA